MAQSTVTGNKCHHYKGTATPQVAKSCGNFSKSCGLFNKVAASCGQFSLKLRLSSWLKLLIVGNLHRYKAFAYCLLVAY